jgi:hypothetical protein
MSRIKNLEIFGYTFRCKSLLLESEETMGNVHDQICEVHRND